MSIIRNPHLRKFVRHSGLKPLYYRFLRDSGYENKLVNTMLPAVRVGDCAWDVGANVGYYTERFAKRVGPAGFVIAIEPFGATFRELTARMGEYPQVRCLKVALGAENKSLRVEAGAYSMSNSLAFTSDSDTAEEIEVRTGMDLVVGGIPDPSILKIDVEGFEEEVLWGLRDVLRSPKCRAVFVEIHNEVLARRGFLRAASRIESMLRDLNYRTHWLDMHLAGFRRGLSGNDKSVRWN